MDVGAKLAFPPLCPCADPDTHNQGPTCRSKLSSKAWALEFLWEKHSMCLLMKQAQGSLDTPSPRMVIAQLI